MNRNFATPQFIPQSPLQRRYNALQQQQHDDENETNNEEINYRPITPQRRGTSTTRSTPLSSFRSPHTSSQQTPHTPRTAARAYDPNITITSTPANTANYTTTGDITFRQSYFDQVKQFELELEQALP